MLVMGNEVKRQCQLIQMNEHNEEIALRIHICQQFSALHAPNRTWKALKPWKHETFIFSLWCCHDLLAVHWLSLCANTLGSKE